MKKYKETFLTKTRFVTTDTEKADNSMFHYSEIEEGKYELSLLGIINGFLSKIGFILVVEIDVDTREIQRHYVTRKWW
ncbi:MAG: hypothetical protein ABS939_08310 [Psychrobacillus sp.]